jgi:xylulokinase
MGDLILAYDLGTGGNKASLFNAEGRCLAEAFVPYQTFYPKPGWHEQRPADWWQAVVESTRQLLSSSGTDPQAIACCGISGHSLGAVPIDRTGRLLRQTTPIWSDARPVEQARRYFASIDESAWYRITGNGFPPPLYTLFKTLWYRDHEPEMFAKTARIIGTKDYINYRLTGFIGTDHSYASGSGVYNLNQWGYAPQLLEASGLAVGIFPEIVASTTVIGTLTSDAAGQLGLPRQVKVVAGGVDNSCMALGARNIRAGRVYNSQGSSSWIAVTTSQPLLEDHARPFVFAHVMPGLYNSAIGVFSTGTSFRWVRDRLCPDLVEQARQQGRDVYDLMTALAAESPAGANGLIFHPNMAGGSSIDPSMHLRGAFLNLDLAHTRADMVRAAMEGIAMQQRIALDVLRSLSPVSEGMLVVGGGSRSRLWRQICADIYSLQIVKTNIDQQAAALGAAALAAVGTGVWRDFAIIDEINRIEDITVPVPENTAVYMKILPVFKLAGTYLSDLGNRLVQQNQ